MKQHYLLIFGLICFFSISGNQPVAKPYLVKQQIQYKCDDATEVYFFWGVNNWMKQDKNLWPPGTVEKNALLCTPMKFKDGIFSVELYAKPNTIIDYVFWITKGPKNVPSDIWDINILPQKDYHSLAANDNITLINSKATVKPSRNLSILDFSGWLLIITLFIFLTAFLARRYVLKNILINPSLSGVILSVGFVVFICGIFSRPSVANFSWDVYNAPAGNFFKMLWMGYYDFIYVLFLTLFFFGLNYLFRNWPRIQKISFIVFSCLSLISVLSVILNIRVVEILGKPFNYRWFYYSGFLNSADSKAAVASNLSVSYILSVIYILVVSVALCLLIIYFFEFIITRFRLRKVAIIIFIFLNLGYLLKANSEIKDYRLNYDLVANPVAAFIESFSPFNKDPGLFTLAVDDSLKFHPLTSNRPTTLKADVSKIKNVILFVLESTPAEYVQPYDSKFNVTPTM